MSSTTTRDVRGLLGEKLGMTQVWDENNRLVPVTVVKAGPCVVTQVRTPATDGYSAVQLGFGAIDPRKVNKPLGGHFEKAGVTPRRSLVELRTSAAADYTHGQEVTVEVFEAGQLVDVVGTTRGKGFAGATGSRVSERLTAHTETTESPARSVAAPPRVECSRACGWPVGWATSARRR